MVAANHRATGKGGYAVMTMRLDRRQLIAGGASLAALATLGGRAALAQDSRVRLMWWGSANRNERTAKVIELFTAANPGVGVEGESAGWDDYWTRLATQTAGGNAPDVMQMDYRYIFEYARRGVLAPLDEAVAAGDLDLSGFSEEAIAGGKVDGKIYGVSLGANSSTMIVNTTDLRGGRRRAARARHHLGRLCGRAWPS